MFSRDVLAHQDARELKTYIINQLNKPQVRVDLSNVKRASMSSIQLIVSAQMHHKAKNKIEWRLSSELQGILKDMGADEFFDMNKGE